MAWSHPNEPRWPTSTCLGWRGLTIDYAVHVPPYDCAPICSFLSCKGWGSDSALPWECVVCRIALSREGNITACKWWLVYVLCWWVPCNVRHLLKIKGDLDTCKLRYINLLQHVQHVSMYAWCKRELFIFLLSPENEKKSTRFSNQWSELSNAFIVISSLQQLWLLKGAHAPIQGATWPSTQVDHQFPSEAQGIIAKWVRC